MLHLSMNPKVGEGAAVVDAAATAFQEEETSVVHFLTQMWLHTSAPARSGWPGRGRMARGGVTAFCHAALLQHHHTLTFSQEGSSELCGPTEGREGKEGGGKAHFLGVCFRPETATCFHQSLVLLMQNGMADNGRTIKSACHSCSPCRRTPSLSLSGAKQYHITSALAPYPPRINPNLAIKRGAMEGAGAE